jgi:DNA modification methylase
MVLAGCPHGGIVLDPFMGSGTTGMVAKELGADFVGIELNPEYAALARWRIAGTRPGLPLLGTLKAVMA